MIFKLLYFVTGEDIWICVNEKQVVMHITKFLLFDTIYLVLSAFSHKNNIFIHYFFKFTELLIASLYEQKYILILFCSKSIANTWLYSLNGYDNTKYYIYSCSLKKVQKNYTKSMTNIDICDRRNKKFKYIQLPVKNGESESAH